MCWETLTVCKVKTCLDLSWPSPSSIAVKRSFAYLFFYERSGILSIKVKVSLCFINHHEASALISAPDQGRS